MADIRKMQIGQVVDFCLAYNERQEQAEREARRAESGGKRRATQEDIDAYFG